MMNKREQVKIARELLDSFNLPDETVQELLESPVDKVRSLTRKFLEKKAQEEDRLLHMSLYEKQLWRKGVSLVAGVDEAGCGPLAGPVIAAAVILPQDCFLWGIDDSKKLSAKKRLILEQEIKEKALCWMIFGVNHRYIDRYNILQARLIAMRKAINRLPCAPEHLLIDGNMALSIDTPQTLINKGDGKSISIAAASIMAKCARDRIMVKMAKLFPEYGFEVNKGYPTAYHRAAIEEFGLSPIHRRSFKIKKLAEGENK
ncbi:MAG: ribonuclease HII [Bacillota bacterium]|jgi:ribonuclease HII